MYIVWSCCGSAKDLVSAIREWRIKVRVASHTLESKALETFGGLPADPRNRGHKIDPALSFHAFLVDLAKRGGALACQIGLGSMGSGWHGTIGVPPSVAVSARSTDGLLRRLNRNGASHAGWGTNELSFVHLIDVVRSELVFVELRCRGRLLRENGLRKVQRERRVMRHIYPRNNSTSPSSRLSSETAS